MNPWDIVSWIGAIAVGLLIIAATLRAIVNLATNPKAHTGRREPK